MQIAIKDQDGCSLGNYDFTEWALLPRQLGHLTSLTPEDVACAFYDLLAGFCVRYTVAECEFEARRMVPMPGR